MHGVILPRPQRCCEKDDAMQRISDKWSLRPLLYETRLELAYRASGRSLETRRIPTVSPRESSRHIEIKYVCNSKSTVLLFVCICICSIFSPSSPLLVSSSPFAMADDLFSPHPSSPSVAPSYFNPISPLFNAYDRFAQWRADLGLPHPGTVENLQKEAKGLSSLHLLFSLLNKFANPATHLSNFIFDGARADLTKSLSMNPLFQVTHAFALGSQTLPSSYNFGAIFANQRVCC